MLHAGPNPWRKLLCNMHGSDIPYGVVKIRKLRRGQSHHLLPSHTHPLLAPFTCHDEKNNGGKVTNGFVLGKTLCAGGGKAYLRMTAVCLTGGGRAAAGRWAVLPSAGLHQCQPGDGWRSAGPASACCKHGSCDTLWGSECFHTKISISKRKKKKKSKKAALRKF